MEFVHTPYQPGETIAAIATPPGEGGIAIIRISGDKALLIADKIFTGPIRSYKSHTAHLGKIVTSNGSPVDEALALVMLGKRSFCGEDTVEIHCHGGSLVSRQVLEVAIHAGARAARPGEFSFKAFINGKIDLSQAEAIQELISAKNDMALQAAENHLEGKLSKKIASFQTNLFDIAAMLEAWVDFPEEDIAFSPMEKVSEDLTNTRNQMQELEASFHDGKILHDGMTLCLVGCPNVGKSSLMNALLDKDRAIVTHIPGTTRDILEDSLRLNGLNLRLIDTAGIRDTTEIVEVEGIRRSKKAMLEADLILFVLDSKKGLQEDDKALCAAIPPEKSIAIWNKMDLPHKDLPNLPFKHTVKISALEKTGLQELHSSIDKVIWEHGPPSKEELIITNIRHKDALSKAIESCDNVINGLATDVSPEFLSMDMRQCLSELGKIIGTNITEDVLSSIFSSFCIGK
ncbi:MAG: tRNA modification GTPase [Chlamydiales bacterium]|jgi:tRNA modification GTPase